MKPFAELAVKLMTASSIVAQAAAGHRLLATY